AQVPCAGSVDGETIASHGQYGHVLGLRLSDGGVNETLLVGGLRCNLLLIDPDAHQHAGYGIAAAAVDDEAHQASLSGLGDDGDVGDDDDGVGAQFAVGGLHQVHASVAHRHGEAHALPLLVCRNVPPP